MRLDVVSIFPEYLAPLDLSLIGKARTDGLIDLAVHDLRDFTHDRHRTVDDTPYGGGAGMVMKPQPWSEALSHVLEAGRSGGAERPVLIVPGPGGERFSQPLARELAQEPWLAFACGRYEGIDERVYDHARDDLGLDVRIISLGDYVLNGGEVAVLAMVEAIARLVPGVIGNEESLVEESHEDGLLEYPVYTKPATWTYGERAHEVPSVLLSGDHGRIATWRHQQRLERTAARRPDLLHPSGALSADHPLAGLDVAVAGPADAAELAVLQRACWTEVPGGEGEAIAETADDLLAARAEWTTWIARSGGRLIATIRARRDPKDATVWQMERLMVVHDLRGRGLGQSLMALVEEQAPSDVRSYWITTGADRARALKAFRRAGYRPVPGEGALPGTVDLRKRR
ncbi:tRNA (guanosine(37)-N1)-methyltransferase TrmD [Janibacter sp. G56]|uniref:tRNA (guanosine(37)-N1)-methyltransferase TrmD n=1 Tax=Janibacter sp. G56 TaxID=3418717 RepID=UPI003CFBEEDD